MNFRRAFYKFANTIRKIYWFLLQSHTNGVKVVIVWKGKLLMIRNTYGEGAWTFPGGGIKPDEAAEAAAMREVAEELGIKISTPVLLGSFTHKTEYHPDTVSCLEVTANDSNFTIDEIEISEARWMTLPDVRRAVRNTVAARATLELYEKQNMLG